jgi:poly-gamma-glutamate synthesis protein (capsule biosynthesis protein)
VEQADFSLVNLEAPIVEGKGSPIKKAGPNLKCNKSAIEALRYVGFKGVTLANNHFYDYGEEGALNTMALLNKVGISYVGAGKNLAEASRIFYQSIGNKTVAFINCCEHEYSIATEQTAGSNPINPVSQYYAISEAKTKADYAVVIVHGGIEGFQLPTLRMQDLYRYFVDCGADVVVNHHQHCYSGYEI